MKIIPRWLIKAFFNKWYRIKPPETVSYWKRGDSARAKIVYDHEGSMKMQIEGEKYLYPGFPRGYILQGVLAGLKHKIKNAVFNDIFAEMQKHMHESLPPEKMCPFAKELWRVFEVMEEAEVVPDMKARIRLIKQVVCFFLQEDDAYRFRAQWALEHLDLKKCFLTKADKYYFRGKYFKVDHDKFDY